MKSLVSVHSSSSIWNDNSVFSVTDSSRYTYNSELKSEPTTSEFQQEPKDNSEVDSEDNPEDDPEDNSLGIDILDKIPLDVYPDLFDIERDGDPRLRWHIYYKFYVTKTEAFWELSPGYKRTEKYPATRPAKIATTKSGKRCFPCCVALCKEKPFASHEDLKLHFNTVHGSHQYTEYSCDYPRCCMFGISVGKDNCRKHYRLTHQEDLPLTGNSLENTYIGSMDYHLVYVIYQGFWRCTACLTIVKVSRHFYTCPKCKIKCESVRLSGRGIVPEDYTHFYLGSQFSEYDAIQQQSSLLLGGSRDHQILDALCLLQSGSHDGYLGTQPKVQSLTDTLHLAESPSRYQNFLIEHTQDEGQVSKDADEQMVLCKNKRPSSFLDLPFSSSKRTKPPAEPSNSDRKWACPFYQRNPGRFSLNTDGSVSKCAKGPGFSEVHRVKEHINKCHTAVHCQRCYEFFKTDRDLKEHMSSPIVCPTRSPREIVTLSEKQKALLRPRDRNQSEIERWRNIYKICFPEDTSCPSPYFSPCIREPTDLRDAVLAAIDKEIVEEFPIEVIKEHLISRVMSIFEKN